VHGWGWCLKWGTGRPRAPDTGVGVAWALGTLCCPLPEPHRRPTPIPPTCLPSLQLQLPTGQHTRPHHLWIEPAAAAGAHPLQPHQRAQGPGLKWAGRLGYDVWVHRILWEEGQPPCWAPPVPPGLPLTECQRAQHSPHLWHVVGVGWVGWVGLGRKAWHGLSMHVPECLQRCNNTWTSACALPFLSLTCPHPHTHTRAHKRTHPHTHTHTHTHARAHTHTPTRAHRSGMAVEPSGHVLALLKGAEEGKGSGSYPMDSRGAVKSHSKPHSRSNSHHSHQKSSYSKGGGGLPTRSRLVRACVECPSRGQRWCGREWEGDGWGHGLLTPPAPSFVMVCPALSCTWLRRPCTSSAANAQGSASCHTPPTSLRLPPFHRGPGGFEFPEQPRSASPSSPTGPVAAAEPAASKTGGAAADSKPGGVGGSAADRGASSKLAAELIDCASLSSSSSVGSSEAGPAAAGSKAVLQLPASRMGGTSSVRGTLSHTSGGCWDVVSTGRAGRLWGRGWVRGWGASGAAAISDSQSLLVCMSSAHGRPCGP